MTELIRNDKFEGYLKKWTNYMKQYQRRWFVYENSYLTYYKSDNDVGELARCQVCLRGCRLLLTSNLGFNILKNNEIIFILKSENSSDFEKWLSVLRHGIIMANKINLKDCSLNKTYIDLKNSNDMIKYNSLVVYENCKQMDLFVKEIEMLLLMNYNENNFVRYRESSLDVCNKIRTLRELSNKITQSVNTLMNTCNTFTEIAAVSGALNHYTVSDSLMSDNISKTSNTSKERLGVNNTTDYLISSEEEFFDVLNNSTDSLSPINKNSNNSSHLHSTDRTIQHARSVSDIPSQCKVPTHMRRTKIPNRPNIKISLWSLISNMIGKDLSKVPLPVNFNEPLSMLQRVCESLEYSHLLDKAANCDCSLLQMCYVLAFTVSNYSSTSHRTSKPFNPLLGETFEFDRTDDMGWRVICEQVSHHPPVCALHVEGRGWILSETYDVKSKFMAKYLEIQPQGLSQLHFTRTGFRYSWNKVYTAVNNIVIGTLWIDQFGTMNIKNISTGETGQLEYYAYSVFKSNEHKKVSGFVKDKNSDKKYNLVGYWDKYIEINKLLRTSSNSETVIDRQMIWAAHPLPELADKMYHFSSFTCSLNEPDSSVAPTDSRNRPDQRIMENGNFDKANELKVKLEEGQRQRRKKILQDAIQNGTANKNTTLEELYQPLWFKVDKTVDHTACPIYAYKGGYWEAKAQKDFSVCPNIFQI